MQRGTGFDAVVAQASTLGRSALADSCSRSVRVALKLNAYLLPKSQD
ncbi:MAG: hypothetical protein F6K26_49050 [Moorea sp. SIO2I5]|nr:hypothetical protein [Moorena sp. SIO2I5]